MINETLIVKRYLEGKDIDADLTYRSCFLLTKWYRENGVENKFEIRKRIFHWASDNGIYININVNDCIDKAIKNERRLTSDNPIRISKADIQEIKDRFDNRNTRLVALGMLCYAKQFANQNSEFSLPIIAFSKWIGIAYNHLSSRYIPELIDYEYVSKKEQPTFSWRGVTKSRSPVFKIKVPIVNEGEWVIENNDIRKLFNDIFGN